MQPVAAEVSLFASTARRDRSAAKQTHRPPRALLDCHCPERHRSEASAGGEHLADRDADRARIAGVLLAQPACCPDQEIDLERPELDQNTDPVGAQPLPIGAIATTPAGFAGTLAGVIEHGIKPRGQPCLYRAMQSSRRGRTCRNAAGHRAYPTRDRHTTGRCRRPCASCG